MFHNCLLYSSLLARTPSLMVNDLLSKTLEKQSKKHKEVWAHVRSLKPVSPNSLSLQLTPMASGCVVSEYG